MVGAGRRWSGGGVRGRSYAAARPGATFGQCLASDRYADLIAANHTLAYDVMGVFSVPTVMVTVGGETRQVAEENGATIARVIDEMTR
jgi:hypothetical protein